MSLTNKLFCRVFGSSNEPPEQNASTTMPPANTKKDEADAVLDSFIARDPQTRYTFDSERGAPESEICREGGKLGKECIKLQMQSKRLFEAMQARGFFCSLPMDPSRTYMDCKPMPK
ncbi:hypothetical protein PLICRDRAFT_41912 [Plicaturopsis crispa FD-325 SS-3]|nr:hypothetical protein PLICRDRAFT_41912 [Plicaturopsis crispa FD-325 SS-3]